MRRFRLERWHSIRNRLEPGPFGGELIHALPQVLSLMLQGRNLCYLGAKARALDLQRAALFAPFVAGSPLPSEHANTHRARSRRPEYKRDDDCKYIDGMPLEDGCLILGRGTGSGREPELYISPFNLMFYR